MNADHRWTIVMLSPYAFSDRCWSQMNADACSKLSTHSSVSGETLDERWVVATQLLHTLGERYSIVVHVRGALLDRCLRQKCYSIAVINFLYIIIGIRACHTLAISLNDRVTHEKISRTLASADHRWTIVMLSPCALSDRCWSQMNADERWGFWTFLKLPTHSSV